jgi:hypothetical protein
VAKRRRNWGGARAGAGRPRSKPLTRHKRDAIVADYVARLATARLTGAQIKREQIVCEVAALHEVTVGQVKTCLKEAGVRRRHGANKQFLKSPVAKKNLKVLRQERQATMRAIRKAKTVRDFRTIKTT